MTRSRCESIKMTDQDDSRFKLFLHQKNFGVIFTLNAGISKSKAPFLYLGIATSGLDTRAFCATETSFEHSCLTLPTFWPAYGAK